MIDRDAEIQACCANLYASEWATLALGDSFHPGGLGMTERVGQLLELRPGHHVLDVASGPGSSAVFLAERFGVEVVGVDFGSEAVARATQRAEAAGLGSRVRFERGDAQRLPFPNASFDAVVCECAFCTFPDKPRAAGEFRRVLRPHGRVGLADLTLDQPLPADLQTRLAWLACLGAARPVGEYLAYLRSAGLDQPLIEHHDGVLKDLVRLIRTRLLSAEVLAKLGKLPFPIASLDEARQLARAAEGAIDQGILGYALLVTP